ncbi:unnamed protein product [Didymodactylos carnosus]|uniref:D-alanyl-D-alanine carboxypeptidase n=1 Tax=Didymodactylos carnosus TaxID=1234261 RepID=A0A8S2JZ72_9BILA|nr:unnamed protein product [Didymodactylos carnosus]CAF3827729.1 unnamed protein product [Didymodactylos carnosus]
MTIWNNFTRDSQLSHASYSLTVLNSKTGDILFGQNEDFGLSPASTLKTITAAVALHYLGKDFIYMTLLQHSGDLHDDGFLDRYIYIVGIKRCRGIAADISLWNSTQWMVDGYTWHDYYGAGHNALDCRENQFTMYLQPGKNVNDQASIVGLEMIPPSVTFINELTTSAAGMTGDEDAPLYLSSHENIGCLRGTVSLDVPRNFLIRSSIPDAALYITNELKQAMQERNIFITEPCKTITTIEEHASDRKTIRIHQSPTLDHNRITTSAIAGVLFSIQKEECFNEFYNSLPNYKEHTYEKRFSQQCYVLCWICPKATKW